MRSPPPEVVATWPKPNYVDPVRRGNESEVVQSFLAALVTVILIIRLYARIAITKAGIGLDDTMMIISWVRPYIQTVPAQGLVSADLCENEAD